MIFLAIVAALALAYAVYRFGLLLTLLCAVGLCCFVGLFLGLGAVVGLLCAAGFAGSMWAIGILTDRIHKPEA
jgi:hypothetical protein